MNFLDQIFLNVAIVLSLFVLYLGLMGLIVKLFDFFGLCLVIVFNFIVVPYVLLGMISRGIYF